MLFIIYLEAAIQEVRTLDAGLYSHGGGQRYCWGESLTETKYADDVDFICMSLRILDELVSAIASRLKPWNKQVNEGKTERITIQPGTRDQARFKKLGFQIDRDLDVTYRIERANICFYALLKLWARSLTAAPINKRMHIYNLGVKMALLYNIEATVLTEAGLQKLETAHRRHI